MPMFTYLPSNVKHYSLSHRFNTKAKLRTVYAYVKLNYILITGDRIKLMIM